VFSSVPVAIHRVADVSCFLLLRPPPRSPPFPYTPLFRSSRDPARLLRLPGGSLGAGAPADLTLIDPDGAVTIDPARFKSKSRNRSEEHTSELQSRSDLVCRLLLEKKKNNLQPVQFHSGYW